MNIDDFQRFHDKYGSLQAESAIKRVGSLIRDSVSEIERVGRFGDNEFAVILPEKSKRRAKEIAETIRKKIEVSFHKEQEDEKKLTVSGSVSENPLDGVAAEELITKAKILLATAKTQGKNRVVI